MLGNQTIQLILLAFQIIDYLNILFLSFAPIEYFTAIEGEVGGLGGVIDE